MPCRTEKSRSRRRLQLGPAPRQPPIAEIHPARIICFVPNEKHWHSATPTTAMTHIAIQEKLDGKAVEWMEKVTDDQYKK